jgi:hypothetical protein
MTVVAGRSFLEEVRVGKSQVSYITLSTLILATVDPHRGWASVL